MGSSNVLNGMIILCIVLVAGFFIGRLAAPERDTEEGPIAGTGKDDIPIGETEASASFMQQRVTSLEDQLARHQQHTNALAHDLYGDPLPWPEDLAVEYQSTVFENNVRSALEACATDVEIAAFECDEPPCLAVFRGGEEDWWEKLVRSCPRWVDVYGDTVRITDGMVDCPGGKTERYTILAPIAPQVTGDGPEAEESWELRWEHRTGEIKAAWDCS